MVLGRSWDASKHGIVTWGEERRGGAGNTGERDRFRSPLLLFFFLSNPYLHSSHSHSLYYFHSHSHPYSPPTPAPSPTPILTTSPGSTFLSYSLLFSSSLSSSYSPISSSSLSSSYSHLTSSCSPLSSSSLSSYSHSHPSSHSHSRKSPKQYEERPTSPRRSPCRRRELEGG